MYFLEKSLLLVPLKYTLFIPISAQGAYINHLGWAIICFNICCKDQPKKDDLGHFEVNSQSYFTWYVSFMNRSG